MRLNAGDSRSNRSFTRVGVFGRFASGLLLLFTTFGAGDGAARLYADHGRFRRGLRFRPAAPALQALARAIAASTAAFADQTASAGSPPACCSCLRALARAIAASTAALRGSTASAGSLPACACSLFAGLWRGRWPPPPPRLCADRPFGRFASGLLLLFAGLASDSRLHCLTLRGSPPDIALSQPPDERLV